MKRKGPRKLSIVDCNPKWVASQQAEIDRQLGRRTVSVQVAPEVEAAPKERRVRQSRRSLNRLETMYQDVLHLRHGKENVRAQDLRLQLANGAWYKPDFFVPSELLFIEVKGPHAFRGGFEFLKMAAAAHPWAKFRLVWKAGDQWRFQEVLP